MAMAFDTHLLNFEENWFVRDHPFDITCVKVKRLVKEVSDAEDALDLKRKVLEDAVRAMNARRVAAK